MLTTLFNLLIGPGVVLGLGIYVAIQVAREPASSARPSTLEVVMPLKGRWLSYGAVGVILAVTLTLTGWLADMVLPKF